MGVEGTRSLTPGYACWRPPSWTGYADSTRCRRRPEKKEAVDLQLSDDQVLFDETTARFLETSCPISTVREWAEKE